MFNSVVNVPSAAHRGHLQSDVSLSAFIFHRHSPRVHRRGSSARLSDAGPGEREDRDGSTGLTSHNGSFGYFV